MHVFYILIYYIYALVHSFLFSKYYTVALRRQSTEYFATSVL